MGVEPTRRDVRHNGFEDRESHRAPVTSRIKQVHSIFANAAGVSSEIGLGRDD